MRQTSAHDGFRRKLVDPFHRLTCKAARLLNRRLRDRLRTDTVRQKIFILSETVAFYIALHRVLHALEQVEAAVLAPRLCNRDEVRQPRTRIQANHVRCDTTFQIF